MASQLLANDDQLLIDSHDLTAPLRERTRRCHARARDVAARRPALRWRPVDIQVSGAAAAVDMPRPKGFIIVAARPSRAPSLFRTAMRRAALAALGCCAAAPWTASPTSGRRRLLLMMRPVLKRPSPC